MDNGYTTSFETLGMTEKEMKKLKKFQADAREALDRIYASQLNGTVDKDNECGAMTAHELAGKLLEMPNVLVYVDIGKGEVLKNIKDVELCSCGAEIFIKVEDY